MKIKSKIIIAIILALSILFIKTESKADNIKEGNEVDSIVELIPKVNTIQKDVPIQIDVKVKNPNVKIGGIDFIFEYNEDIFYKLKDSDITHSEDDYLFSYDEENKCITIVLKESINEATMCTITLTPKKTIDITNEKIQLLKLNEILISKMDGYIDSIDKVELLTPEPPKEKLYLSSDIYKIGNNDIKNYEKGDKYISRVVRNTTLSNYIKNLKTNGKIRVLKSDGKELTKDELVGTGMTLEVTKDDEKIELKIAVMGDLSGDGKVTAQDLSTIQSVLLGEIELKDVFFVAADFEEINKMKTSYLAEINHMCLL